jgi:hypothetical protein
VSGPSRVEKAQPPWSSVGGSGLGKRRNGGSLESDRLFSESFEDALYAPASANVGSYQWANRVTAWQRAYTPSDPLVRMSWQ